MKQIAINSPPDETWLCSLQYHSNAFSTTVPSNGRADNTWLSDRLAEISKALMTAVYCGRFADISSVGAETVCITLEDIAHRLCSTALPEGPDTQFYGDMCVARREAQADLHSAFNSLRAALMYQNSQSDQTTK